MTAPAAPKRRAVGGMDRRLLRDWAVRFNAEGPQGLTSRKAPGHKPELSSEQLAELVRLVEDAPGGFPRLLTPGEVPPPVGVRAWIEEGQRVLSSGAAELRYAIVLSLATGAAILVARHFSLANGYWAAMTVLLVLRRGGVETLTRGAQRIGGTLVGAAAAICRPTVDDRRCSICGAPQSNGCVANRAR